MWRHLSEPTSNLTTSEMVEELSNDFFWPSYIAGKTKSYHSDHFLRNGLMHPAYGLQRLAGQMAAVSATVVEHTADCTTGSKHYATACIGRGMLLM